MNIKVQCSCQTKFSFEVEPIEGRMPATIFCPTCGADATALANQVIQQNSSSATAAVATPKLGIRLQVAHQPAAPTPVADAGDAVAPAIEMCHRHPRNAATEHCVVCKKPICPECMQSFGFLCSINCRYRADQESIKVPVYKFQRNVVEKGETRKTVAIAAGVALVLLGIAVGWFWYISVGLKPRPFYSLKIPADRKGVYAKFLGPDQILLLKKNQVSLHSIKSKHDAWSTALADPKPDPEAKPASTKKTENGAAALEENLDFSAFEDYSSLKAPPFFNGDDLWVCMSHGTICVDLKTGSIKHTIPFQGRLTAFTPGDSTLLIVSEKVPTKKLVTQINLSSGEVKTAEVASSLREKVTDSKDLPSDVLPTASLLLKYEIEGQEKGHPSIYKWSSEFFPAGQNLVEMQVQLIEAKVTTVQTMKTPGPSNLNSDTRASTSARAVLEEISNEMKRNSGGGFKRVDQSRYAVTLRRTMEAGAADWTNEVVSLPAFFPQKTVDVLVAGKSLFLFDKQNKKIAESQLTYPIDDGFTSGYRSAGASPCVEANNVLYFFDKGVLTAMELPSGTVRWRLTSVGISGIQFDEKGMLYVSTTTAAPEDIQYSEQIKVADAIRPIILKVDPKLGKTLWKSQQNGSGCFLTGKFVYMTDAARSGAAMINAVEDAFGSTARGESSFQLYRINPSNGKKMWSFTKAGMPSNIDFSHNRILLHYSDEIQIMKFISF